MTSFRCGTLGLALLSMCSLGSSNAAADTISTWNGGSGNWSTAGQWTPSRVPNNTAGQFYDVTIGRGSTTTLDISPTINSLTLNGSLAQGYAGLPNPGYTTLTVNGNATVNGGFGGSYADGWRDSLIMGGNLTNNGYMDMGSTVSIAGNMKNSGSVVLLPGGPGGFSVGGTLVNTGSLQWGNPIGAEYGPRTSLGGLVNKGSVAILFGSIISVTGPQGVSDIPKGSSWFIDGAFNGFAHLTGIEGSLDIEGTNGQGAFSPLILGSPGNTIHNSSPITIGSSYGPSVVNVIGNFSNTGNLAVAYQGQASPRPPFGPSTLNISGTLTNQAAGTISVNFPSSVTPSPGSLNAGNLVNYGAATFNAGTASTAKFFENSGTVNIYGDQAGDIGSLTVGTLKTAAGLITVYNNGGLLTVGSGAVPAGFSGYDQFANGVFMAAGGGLLVQGPVDLNGTLDIMLGDGYKPVGAVFTVLYSGRGPLTGAFSNVEGLVFDGGREKYVLTYSDPYAGVFLTVENNATPEPGSGFLVLLGSAGMLGIGAARKRSHRLAPSAADLHDC